jgi:hypothetical protein
MARSCELGASCEGRADSSMKWTFPVTVLAQIDTYNPIFTSGSTARLQSNFYMIL